jgi:hypothetical protein
MGLGIRSLYVRESHSLARSSSLYFHRVVPKLVLSSGPCSVCRVDRTFEVFDNLDLDLAQFVKLRVSLDVINS